MFSMFIGPKRYDAFAEQSCILNKGQKTFVIVIQQSLRIWVSFTLGWVASCFTQSHQPVVVLVWIHTRQCWFNHSCCEDLMDYSLRKQVPGVHLCSWLTPRAKRAVQRKSNCSSAKSPSLYGPHLSCILYSVTDNKPTCVQLGLLLRFHPHILQSLHVPSLILNKWISPIFCRFSLSCRYCHGHLIKVTGNYQPR